MEETAAALSVARKSRSLQIVVDTPFTTNR